MKRFLLMAMPACFAICMTQQARADQEQTVKFQKDYISFTVNGFVHHFCSPSDFVRCVVHVRIDNNNEVHIKVNDHMVDATPYDDGSGNIDDIITRVESDLATIGVKE